MTADDLAVPQGAASQCGIREAAASNGCDLLGPWSRTCIHACGFASDAAAGFDPVWQQDLLPRPDAYLRLAQELGISRHRCHIGLMELEDCRRVGQIVWERFGVISG
ncbi:zinc-finger-containing protein [Paucibacter sp. JuS9]|uniref:zinc-finger-containing protein n=1 Tax=Paucibacter sp. JuS9 TaxID=3228748 RepID=UPI00375634B9